MPQSCGALDSSVCSAPVSATGTFCARRVHAIANVCTVSVCGGPICNVTVCAMSLKRPSTDHHDTADYCTRRVSYWPSPASRHCNNHCRPPSISSYGTVVLHFLFLISIANIHCYSGYRTYYGVRHTACVGHVTGHHDPSAGPSVGLSLVPVPTRGLRE